MPDVSKALEKIAAAPWRPGLVVLGASFLAATAVSTVMGYLVQPAPGSARPMSRPASSNFSVPEPTATLTKASIETIVKRNLFNSEGVAGAGQQLEGGSSQDGKAAVILRSTLPIVLMGTIYGGDPLSGIALIENSTKKTINSFIVGDSLQKDVTLTEIHKEKVIISNAGRSEYIEVLQEKLSRSKRKRKSIVPVDPADIVAPLATEPPPPSFKEDGFERKERDISLTQAYREKLLTTDFTKVLQDAKATPNMVDGELKGFKLDRIRKDSIYEKSGLQNDDIITEVNGVPLSDAAQAIRLLQSLRKEAEIDIRIIRATTPMTFNLRVK